MTELSLHPIHAALKPYIRFFSILRVDNTAALKLVLTATTDSVILFHFGSKVSTIAYDFPNIPSKTYTFPKHDMMLGWAACTPSH